MDGRSKEHRTNDLGFILPVLHLYIVVPPPNPPPQRGGQGGGSVEAKLIAARLLLRDLLGDRLIQNLDSSLRGVDGLGQGLPGLFGIMESIAVFCRPPLPEGIRPIVLYADFVKNVFADPQVFGEDIGVDQLPEREFSFPHLTPRVGLDRVYLILCLLLCPIGMAPQTSLFQYGPGSAGAV